jgi:hypothetical protein
MRFVVVLAGMVAVATAAKFAAPEVIVFGGGPLEQRVTLADWPENLRLMQATSTRIQISPESLRARPRMNVAMYWGSHWRGWTRTPLTDTVSSFDKLEGAQPGAFYPAHRGRKAIWVFGPTGTMPSSARSVSAPGLEILRRHGVPVSVR